jgi:hypothetical protein
MATPSALVERLVAVEAGHGMRIDWLGSLVWSTITESSVTADQLSAAAKAAGIPEKYLPGPAHPKDAMRRAAKAAEAAKVPAGQGRFVNIMARQVAQTPTGLVYRLVRELVNAENRRLDYRQVAELVLEGDLLTWTGVDRLEDADREAAARAIDAYDRHRTTFDGIALRRCIGEVLRDCDPVSVRPSGGVVFVPMRYDATVEALRRFVDEIAPYGTTAGHESVLRSVPVVDATEQRAMVKESLEDQVAAEAAAILDDVRKAVAGKVTSKAAAAFVARVQELRAMAGTYEEVLRTKLTDLEATVDVLLLQTRELLAAAE